MNQDERFVCECGHHLDKHYPDPAYLKPLCEDGGCWCSGYREIMIHRRKDYFDEVCQCSHRRTNHDKEEGPCSGWCDGHDCNCPFFTTDWHDRPICQCGHESHEHVAPSDPFAHYICNGEWSDQGMPIPCCCIKYVETTQNKMWAEQENSRPPFIKKRESLWRQIIKFLF